MSCYKLYVITHWCSVHGFVTNVLHLSLYTLLRFKCIFNADGRYNMLFSNSPKTPSIQLFWRRTVLVQIFLVLNCPTLGRLHKKAWQKNNQIDLKLTAAVHLILKEIHFLRDNVTTMQVFISNVVKFTKTKSTHFRKGFSFSFALSLKTD